MRRALIAAACVLFTPALDAAVSPALTDWANGPASFLFTDAELATWKALATDQEAADFVRLFWARRDPDPKTPENEARLAFEQRVAAADQRFTDGGDTRGAMTDRGRVLILLGAPNRAAKEGGSAFDSSGGGGGEGSRPALGSDVTTFGEAFEEVWTYEKDRLPAKAKTNRLLIRFRTERGYGTGVMNREGRVMNTLAEAAAAMITRPTLTLADLGPETAAATPEPAYRAWKAESLADEATIVALGGAEATAPAAEDLVADLEVGVFQASDGAWEVLVQVMTAAAATTPAELVGVVLGEDGSRHLAFRNPTAWRTSGGRSYLAQTLLLPAGSYDLRLGLLADGQLRWRGGERVVVPTIDGFWLSEVLLSEDIAALKEAQEVYDPWAWGGIAVVPTGGARFAPGAGMWFYLHACNPQLGEDGKPALKVVAEVTGPRRLRGPMPIDPTPAGTACWVVATGLDLVPEKFPAGSYTIKVQVTDALAGTTQSVERGFTIVAPDAG